MPDNLTSGARVLGSVSTGYSDRPVARAIKIKHAGLNLTDPWLLYVVVNMHAKVRDVMILYEE